MHARIFLLTLGLLGLVVAPGCCVLRGCGTGCGCGGGCGLLGCLSRIRDKIHNCSLCHKSNCCGDCGCSCGGGMMYGDMGMAMGDCGCGAPAAPGCGCGAGGGHAGHAEPSTFMTPPMNVPTMQSAPPVPNSNVTMPPPIPPADSSSTTNVPQGTQQVSVEEFQRLPGVIISGPGAASTAAPASSSVVQSPTPVPANVAAPAPAAKPIQQASGTTAPVITPSATRQVQQTGWAPVRQ